MIIVRAFAEYSAPAGRPHIRDGWQRVPVDHYDYRHLLELGDDVVCMDWDTAASREDLLTFVEHAESEPGRILAAPCLLYRRDLPSRWSVGSFGPGRPGECCEWQPGGEGDSPVAFSGFGMIYLPHAELVAYAEANPGAPLNDVLFCHWRHHRGLPPFEVAWDVRPVHLNYPEAVDGVVGARPTGR